MSTYPTQPGQPQTTYYQPPPTNALGVAGFVVSLTGMVVCGGLISPIGLILSMIALTKQPRGFAIAGSIIGALGSLMGVVAVLMFAGIIGGFSSMFSMSATSFTIDSASYEIDNHFSTNSSTLPDEPTGDALISSYLDEWGQTLKYEPSAGTTDQYTITSPGEDGVFGTTDDISNSYTAYNWGATSTVGPGFLQEPEAEDIEAAFGVVADKVNKAFPFGTTEVPSTEQVTERVGPLFDPWQTPMRYRPSATPPYFNLESAGPDQVWGTEDDINRPYYFAPTGESDGPL